MLRRLYGIVLIAFWLSASAGAVRGSDTSPVVVPYEVDAISPVRVPLLQPICRPDGLCSSVGLTEGICRPDGLPYTEGINPGNNGTVGFYVLFRTGGIHRQTLLCTNGDKWQKIAIEYVPGKIDASKVPIEESAKPIPKECAGLRLPDVRMLSPQDGATKAYRNGLFYAVSDPQGPVRLAVHFLHGQDAIKAHGTLFDISGLPKAPPGYWVENAAPDNPLAAGTTYTVEVAFEQSWATPGMCSAPFSIGEFTTGPP
jgi:hypothetical protein